MEWSYNRTIPCECHALAHKNNIVAASNGHKILIIDAATGSHVAIFSGHLDDVTCLAFSMEGTLLVSGSKDCTVKIWDVQTGGVIKSFDHVSSATSVSISADNTMVAIGLQAMSIEQQGGSIKQQNIETGEQHHMEQHHIMGRYTKFLPVVSFSPKNS